MYLPLDRLKVISRKSTTLRLVLISFLESDLFEYFDLIIPFLILPVFCPFLFIIRIKAASLCKREFHFRILFANVDKIRLPTKYIYLHHSHPVIDMFVYVNCISSIIRLLSLFCSIRVYTSLHFLPILLGN